MTVYAVGDIQGCARSFDALLERIAFDPPADHLWIAGDLVNRGPDSLGVLRRAMALGDAATVVLGNHDLHLLAIVAGVRPPWPGDTFDEILAAPDRGELMDWLRSRPLLHYDQRLRTLLVHAGVPPEWTLAAACDRAAEVSSALSGPGWQDVLQTLYGNEPSRWSPELDAVDRRRFTINALTRMRYCDTAGRLDFDHSGPPGSQPAELRPWYELCDVGGDGDSCGGVDTSGGIDSSGEVDSRGEESARGVHIVFGHWASLGLVSVTNYSSTSATRFTCIDTGCVWGRTLTALPIDPPGEPVWVGYLDGQEY